MSGSPGERAPASSSDESRLADLLARYHRDLLRGEASADALADVPSHISTVSLSPEPARRLAAAQACLRLLERSRIAGALYADRGDNDSLRGPASITSRPETVTARADGERWFAGTARCPVLRRIGAGGMGVVYEAFDRQLGERVALKTMRRVDPAALLQCKREFRALADVTHPNLVTLHELFAAGERWFFTMELVDGTDFLSFVRGAAGLDWDRLPVAMRQLAAGLCALHDAGKLHRDIKPSNVLVSHQGRLVLVDFGLLVDWKVTASAGGQEPGPQPLVGTAPYMAPEQAARRPVTPASDWYSVGVMLFQALTGQLPFGGTKWEQLAVKQLADPPAPHTIAPGVPRAWSDLCVALLSRDPNQRPTGHEVLRQLGGEVAAVLDPFAPAGFASAPGAYFVGRAQHLAALDAALAELRRGQPVRMLVQGRSGVGKSSLVRRFLDGLRSPDVLVLAGRCYERESVPYKVFDGVIDALSQQLRSWPAAELAAIRPRDTRALLRVFPVLRQVPWNDEASAEAAGQEPLAPGGDPAAAPDPHELRRLAFAALRELLTKIGRRLPLVVFVDDLQWGDADSAALLAELLRPPDPPVLLWLGSFRSEDAATSPFVGRLADAGGAWRELPVEPLAPTEACDLARTLLGADETPAESIARESEGSPYFLHELARHVRSGATSLGPARGAGSVALDEVLWQRVERLAADARRLLQVVAVAGRPVGPREACRAAQVETDPHFVLGGLRRDHLVRTAGTDLGELEPYHDRIRETVVRHLSPPELRSCHRRLAEVLEASGTADPETLAIHFRDADEPDRAGPYYVQAAARAAATLAFERAAQLYRSALELRPGSDQERRVLRRHLADALANAGRGAEAAREYLAAATGADPFEALDLERHGAYQFCISGHIDEGLATLGAVLNRAGLRWPRSRRAALVSFLFGRLRLRFRGLGFRVRTAAELDSRALTRLDVSWSAAVGLTMIDTIRGADFQVRNLRLALQAGEPFRLARALAWSATHLATAGEATQGRTQQLLATADSLAQQIDLPYARGLVTLSEGIAAYFQGRWKASRQACDRAETLFRERCTGVVWEVVTAQSFALWALHFQGELATIAGRLPGLLNEARRRGDRLAEASFSNLGGTIVQLAADDCAAARDLVQSAMACWSQQEFHTQHFTSLAGMTQIDLYVGDGLAGWRRLDEQWPALRGSMLLEIEAIRIYMRHLRARCALAAAAQARDPEPWRKAADREARKLERERASWARPLARLVRAGLAARHDVPSAAVGLAHAAAEFEAADMRLFAATARRQQGRLLGDTALIEAADAWLSQQGIHDPAAMTALHVPM